MSNARADVDLEAAEAAIHADPDILGGEPVFRGTRVPVYGIAQMVAAGADRNEILSGYPALDARQLGLAVVWAGAHPPQGRPVRLADQGVQPASIKHVVLGGDPLASTRRR